MKISFKTFLKEDSIPVTGVTLNNKGKIIPAVFCPVGTRKYKKSNGEYACKLITKLKKIGRKKRNG